MTKLGRTCFAVVLLASAAGLGAEPVEVKAPAADVAPRVAFDELWDSAKPVNSGDLARMVEPLVSECPADQELSSRQCRSVRDWALSHSGDVSYRTLGDGNSIRVSPYDPARKLRTVEFFGCIACSAPVDVDGRPVWVSSEDPESMKSGKPSLPVWSSFTVSLVDVKASDRFEKEVAPQLRAQLVFQPEAKWSVEKSIGVRVKLLGYRVYNRCTGEVFLLDPHTPKPYAKIAREPDASCPAESDPAEVARRKQAAHDALPETLSIAQVEKSLGALKSQMHACFVHFERGGTITIKMTILGEGKFESLELAPPYDKEPIGDCVLTALKTAKFPPFKTDKIKLTYPMMLH